MSINCFSAGVAITYLIQNLKAASELRPEPAHRRLLSAIVGASDISEAGTPIIRKAAIEIKRKATAIANRRKWNRKAVMNLLDKANGLQDITAKACRAREI